MRKRRGWRREVGNPLSMFHDKKQDGNRENDWSAKRVAIVMFGAFYLWHWPDKIEMPDVYLAALILGALAFYALVERVPVAETLAAIQAIAGKVVTTRTAVATKAMSAVHQPHEWSSGDPDSGII